MTTHRWWQILFLGMLTGLGSCGGFAAGGLNYTWHARIRAERSSPVVMRPDAGRWEADMVAAEKVGMVLRRLLCLWSSKYGMLPVGQRTGEFSWEKRYSTGNGTSRQIAFR